MDKWVETSEDQRKYFEISLRRGYSNYPIMADFRSYGFSGVIAKPYRISEMSRLLKQVIEGGQTTPSSPILSDRHQ